MRFKSVNRWTELIDSDNDTEDESPSDAKPAAHSHSLYVELPQTGACENADSCFHDVVPQCSQLPTVASQSFTSDADDVANAMEHTAAGGSAANATASVSALSKANLQKNHGNGNAGIAISLKVAQSAHEMRTSSWNMEQRELAMLSDYLRSLASSCCVPFTCRHEMIPKFEMLNAFLPTLDAALRLQALEALVTVLHDCPDPDPSRSVIVRTLILAQLASPEVVTSISLEELVGDIIAIGTSNCLAHTVLLHTVNLLKIILPHNTLLEHEALEFLKTKPKRRNKKSRK